MSKKRKRQQGTGTTTAPPSDAPNETSSGAVSSPIERTPKRTRRDFLIYVGKGTAGTCALMAGLGALRFVIPDVARGAQTEKMIGVLADFKMNTLTWLREYDLFVTRDEDGIGAFSSQCTHLGCTVRKTATGFQCPCHGQVFDEKGAVVSGPSRKPLPWYPVEVRKDGRLWVDMSSPFSAGKNGSPPRVVEDGE